MSQFSDFDGEAVVHVEVDGEPVNFGRDDTRATGNIALYRGHEPYTFEVAGHEVTIELEDFVDRVEGGV